MPPPILQESRDPMTTLPGDRRADPGVPAVAVSHEKLQIITSRRARRFALGQ